MYACTCVCIYTLNARVDDEAKNNMVDIHHYISILYTTAYCTQQHIVHNSILYTTKHTQSARQKTPPLATTTPHHHYHHHPPPCPTLHIMYDNIAPDDPISAPTVVNKSFPNINPSAANAYPLTEFNNVMHTGMSAPPTDAVTWAPRVPPAAVVATRAATPRVGLPVARKVRPATALTPRRARLMVSLLGRERGLEAITPCSLPNATAEPVK